MHPDMSIHSSQMHRWNILNNHDVCEEPEIIYWSLLLLLLLLIVIIQTQFTVVIVKYSVLFSNRISAGFMIVNLGL